MAERSESGTVVEKQASRTKPPPMYKVMLLNDDYTPMEFVVVVLQKFFGMSREQATQVMLKVHREGHGRLRRLSARRRRDQSRAGLQLFTPASASAAVRDGGSMIAQELEVSLHMAFVEARQKRHEFITVEHLLLALLDNPSAAEVLRACAREHRRAAQEPDRASSPSNTPDPAAEPEVDTQPTLGFQRVIQRAILHVQSSNGKKEVTGANVLVAIFGEKDSHAVYFLHQQGVTRLDVVNYISHGITKTPQARARREERGRAEEAAAGDGQDQPARSSNYTQNLNALAQGRQDRSADRPRDASSSA